MTARSLHIVLIWLAAKQSLRKKVKFAITFDRTLFHSLGCTSQLFDLDILSV